MIDNQPTQPSFAPNADLDAALASFSSYQPIQASVADSTLGTPAIPVGEPVDVQEQTEEGQEETNDATEEVADEPQVSEGFAAEFKQAFGIEPAEAIETFNSLIAFRDEVRLMGEWNVTPSEYQSRMSQIREFFKTLPEDGQAQFNSVEGAVAIWNHLNKDAANTRKPASVRPATKTTKAQPKAEVIKKSEVLRMDASTYRQNAARIQKAVLEGRFVEDV